MAGLEEARHADIAWEFASEALCEGAAIAWKGEAERAAKNDAIRFEFNGLGDEAEEHTLDDVVPRSAVGDFFDEFTVVLSDGACRGEVFPFVFFAVVGVFFVARFEVAVLA